MDDLKRLKRHPLSAEHRDLSTFERERMDAGIREAGVLNGRKVILHDDQVLDGWQLLQSCIRVGVRPEFGSIPAGMDPRRFVEIVNEARRHESAGDRLTRRKNVLARHKAGSSIREIAEAEGVSVGTVAGDLKAIKTEELHNGDALIDGVPVSERVAMVIEESKNFDTAIDLAQRLLKALARIDESTMREKRPSNPEDKHALAYVPHVEVLLARLKAMKFAGLCLGCDGKGCEMCSNLGWCSAEER